MADHAPERNPQGRTATPARGSSNSPTNGAQTPSLHVPLLPLSQSVVFPKSVYPLAVSGEHAQSLAQAVTESKGLVALFLQGGENLSGTTAANLCNVGTLARVSNVTQVEGGPIQFSAEGLERIAMREVTQLEPYAAATVEILPYEQTGDEETGALFEQVKGLYTSLLEISSGGQKLVPVLEQTTDPFDLAYLVASTISISPQARQAILEASGAPEMLSQLLLFLNKTGEITNSQPQPGEQLPHGGEGNERGGPSASSNQIARTYKLEQTAMDRAEMEARIARAGLPQDAMKQAGRELERLSLLTPNSPDYNMIRSYLQWLADIPWQVDEEPDFDIERARDILDRDHFGLQEVKSRIIEYLAVRKLRRQRNMGVDECEVSQTTDAPSQPILCLVGPPGVGKTSLGRSIAEALNRPFVRISLGGVSDEAEVRGHRRTYLGALPGRIIQSIVRVGSAQPVMMLDELDKLASKASTGGGDPTAALLDVLDPQQQREFVDHYIEVPFDISCIFFVATANSLESVPEALRDRLEIIRLSGYTEEEKCEIALRHLVPRQMEWHALHEGDINWKPDGVLEIIRSYTQEAGVRQMEREIATVCRRVAAMIAQGDDTGNYPCAADAGFITDVLGTPRYLPEEPSATDEPGLVTGVFWTPVGGDIMHIEALLMPGGKTLTITGQLGEVMRESAQTALSYVRAHAHELNIDPTFYETHDLHLHIPSGAVAKDGPSAGIGLATALVSLLTEAPVSSELAMTGEITLRGRVLPVGGVKEKVLAAKRAGIRKMILPTQNKRDLDEVQPELLEDMQIITVDTMEEVLAAAFPPQHKRGLLTRRRARVGRRRPMRRIVELPGAAQGRAFRAEPRTHGSKNRQ